MANEEVQRRRALNQSRLRLFGTNTDRTIAFLCECENEGCRKSVLVSAGDYEARTGQGEFVIHDSHSPPAELQFD